MATINIKLSAKSMTEVANRIENIKIELMRTFPTAFIDECLNWIANRANQYLAGISMDADVIGDIQQSWRIEPVSEKAKRLVNYSDKAVFVEFGVGKVGRTNPHPNSNNENYEYNIPTKSKRSDGSWIFDAEHKQYAIDLNDGFYVMFGSGESNRAKVKTKGSPANLYLYNAGMDLVSTGAYKKISTDIIKQLL